MARRHPTALVDRREDDDQIRRELEKDLAAYTAGRRGRRSSRDDGAGHWSSLTCGNHRGHGRALRTQGCAIRCVLDVAPGEDEAAFRQDCCADTKLRVRRIGLRASSLCGDDKALLLPGWGHRGPPRVGAIHPRNTAERAKCRDAAAASTSA
jgi:hypothetical protein